MPISQSTLRSKASNYWRYSGTLVLNAEGLKSTPEKTAFLCHSHKDEEIVKGLVVTFRESGVDLYVDWQDHTMPEKPNKETAKKIQARIVACSVFLFLATANAKDSRWCPWEIGYADSRSKGVYIIPTSDDHGSCGNEYLELYPKIDTGSNQQTGESGYAVFGVGNDKGQWLKYASL